MFLPTDSSGHNKLDCIQNPDSSVCRLFPFITRYYINDGGGQPEGKTVKVLFSTQSTEAVIYVLVVLLVYAIVFTALIFSSHKSTAGSERPRKRSRRHRTRRKTNTVVRFLDGSKAKRSEVEDAFV